MPAEEVQELGRKGVLAVKRWLESTTHINLDFIVYDNQAMCTLIDLNGGSKRFDLTGRILGSDQRPISVEAKRYSTPGHQGTEYKKFLAIAYSTYLAEREARGETRREYMWVTYHPFLQGEWSRLTKRSAIESALRTYPEYLAGRAIDHDVVDQLKERLWLLVFSKKQESLTLSQKELAKVFSQLKRQP